MRPAITATSRKRKQSVKRALSLLVLVGLAASHLSRVVSSDRHHQSRSLVFVPPARFDDSDTFLGNASNPPTEKVNNCQRREHCNKKIPFRVFPKWNHGDLPCFHPTAGYNNINATNWASKQNLKRPAVSGLFFLKLLKTASSTGASIHVRIARNLARRQPNYSSTTNTTNRTNFDICATRHLHGWAGPRMYQFGKRHRPTSFLWTILREPTKRYLSEFYHFQVSRAGKPLDSAISFLRSGPHSDHHYLAWLSTRRSYRRRKGGRPFVTAREIMQDYDFLGITERLEESAVALMMVLQIPMADILHLNSKTSGGYDDGEYNGRCIKIIQPTSQISSQLQEYLDSPEWKAYIEPEQELYRAANISLDLTIEALGRPEFESNLERFRQAQHVAQEKCAPVVKFPCSSTGELRKLAETDCMHGDVGCGFDCLDKVASEMDIW